ncbi:MAG TPA: methionyl-tRNA formyltransferase [Candidatus Doudnabacteria bacterium]|nr:methionyl-tRNA formyltransferase [Candidatus Doudnabacteria bacterium]
MKIIFFGTSEIGLPILQKLIDEHEVLSVVTSPDKPVGRKQILTPSPIAKLAEECKLPVHKPNKVKDNSEFIETLKSFGANIFIVVSYGKILPLELLSIPPLKTINVHFSLLPKYRGPAPVQFALLNGETKTGSTIFVLDELVDHGPILATAEISIEPSDTNPTLQAKLAKLSADLLIETLPKYEAGQITPIEQDHEQATATKIISKDDGRINWEDSALEIYNRWRAFQPWPGITTEWNHKLLKIVECRLADEQLKLPCGMTQDDLVACGNDSALKLIYIQLEGKKTVDIKDFLNGYPEFSNSSLS